MSSVSQNDRKPGQHENGGSERIRKLIRELRDVISQSFIQTEKGGTAYAYSNAYKRDNKRYSGKSSEKKPESVRQLRNRGQGNSCKDPGRGNGALFAYTKKFDRAEITEQNVRVTGQEIREAYETVDPALVDVIRKSLVNIRNYHEKQKQNSWFTSSEDGTMLGQKVTPLEKVGISPGRKGGLSIFRSYEHCSCKGGRSGPDYYDNTSGAGWEGEPFHSCGSK